jgi:hypothetical protein
MLPLDDPKFLAFCILSKKYCHNTISEGFYIIHWRRIHHCLKWPHKHKSAGLKSDERRGQEFRPPLTIRRPGNFRFRYLQATRLKCEGVPSCMKCSSRWIMSCSLVKKSGISFSQQVCSSALYACLKVSGARINRHHIYRPRCWWRTTDGNVMEVSYLPTDADCESSGFHLLWSVLHP